jgi:hypothetical protein
MNCFSSFRLPWLASLILLVTFTLSGCAGGGGGGTAGVLIYQTDWSNRGNNITGLSQRVSVFDPSGVLLKAIIVNQDADALQQTDIAGVGQGMRHVHIDLFSGRDLGGVKTGELDIWIDVQPGTTFLTGVGDAVALVNVTPATAAIEVQHSKQFYATVYSAPNKATFTASSSNFTWQAFGGVATVSQEGIVVGTAQGSGTVRATHTPSGLNGGASITVNPFSTATSKWTVMVYMNGANDLSQFSKLNMNQIEQVAGNAANVRFVVQWKQVPSLGFPAEFNGTRRYVAKLDNTDTIASELVQDMGQNVDMGDPTTLNDFVQWSRTFYPANRYVLVIWNHGNGWLNRSPGNSPTRGVSYDDETGNFISTPELPGAIGNNQLDIVAWDASLMQMVEVAHEIKDQAKFVVGSEESPPGEGYPYDLIFDKFRDTPDETSANLSKAFVDGMLAVPAYTSRKITQSVIDTTQLDPLVSSLSALADELIANKNSIGAQIQNIRLTTVTQSYSDSNSLHRHFRDIWHLCQNIKTQLSGFPTIVSAANLVQTNLTNAVIWEGHNSNSPNSHGLSIDFSQGTEFVNFNAADYGALRFALSSHWDEWLQQAP